MCRFMCFLSKGSAGRSVLRASGASPIALLMLLALAAATAHGFEESWESATGWIYSPINDDFLHADEGTWLIGDTVSEFPECGPSPHEVNIDRTARGKELRLISHDSNSTCSDNIWLDLVDASRFGSSNLNKGFSIPITARTRIAFEQRGILSNPRRQGWGRNCIGPPCFDNISLRVVDNRGNILAYVLQRSPGAEANIPNANFGDLYREIFLDRTGGQYNRNLFDDFKRLPGFVPNGAEVHQINLSVDEHGWAVFDDIAIGTDIEAYIPAVPEIIVVPETTGILTGVGRELVQPWPTTSASDNEFHVWLKLKAYEDIGRDADWWVVAEFPSGWYYYTYSFDSPASWTSVGDDIGAIAPAYQGKLVSFPSLGFPLFVDSLPALEPGRARFYFGVDLQRNGRLDLGSLRFDFFDVEYQPAGQ